jgi:hypothetical protein
MMFRPMNAVVRTRTSCYEVQCCDQRTLLDAVRTTEACYEDQCYDQ